MRNFMYLFGQGLKSFWKNRTMSLASIVVLVSCLLLTGAALMFSLNMESIMSSIEDGNAVTVYLNAETPKLTSIEVGEQLRDLENVSECTYIPGEEALQEVIKDLGEDGSILDGVGNFMPDAYEITLIDLDSYQMTIDEIMKIESVDKISDYSEIAQVLSDLDVLVTYGSLAIIIILAVASLFIISNTLKVTMFSRRIEINIMKSVGATNAFIRFPFFIEGLFIGLLSGALAGFGLYFAYIEIAKQVYSLLPFIDIIDITNLQMELILAYSGAGVLFGMVGSLISISRYLKREGEKAIV